MLLFTVTQRSVATNPSVVAFLWSRNSTGQHRYVTQLGPDMWRHLGVTTDTTLLMMRAAVLLAIPRALGMPRPAYHTVPQQCVIYSSINHIMGSPSPNYTHTYMLVIQCNKLLGKFLAYLFKACFIKIPFLLFLMLY